MTPTIETERRRELDYRAVDGLEIALLWDPKDDALAVVVADTKTEERFEVPADGRTARDVFYHPFAYAARRSLKYSAAGAAGIV